MAVHLTADTHRDFDKISTFESTEQPKRKFL